MIPTFDTGSLHDEEGRAFRQDRLAFLGIVGALFFIFLVVVNAVVLGPAPRR